MRFAWILDIRYWKLKIEYFLSGRCDWPWQVSGVSPSACCRLSWHSLILEKCKFLFPLSYFVGSIARIQIQTFRALSLKDCNWTCCIALSSFKKASSARYLHSGHDSNMSVRYRVDTGALLLWISYFFSRRGEWPPKVVIVLQQDLVMTATCQCGDHVDMGVLSSDQNTSISRRCPLQISSNDIGNPARK